MVTFHSKIHAKKKIRSIKKRNIQYGGRTEEDIRQELTAIEAQITSLTKTLVSLQAQSSSLHNELWTVQQQKRNEKAEEDRRVTASIDKKWSHLGSIFQKSVLLPENAISAELILARDNLIKRINDIDIKIKEELKKSWSSNLPELEATKQQLETDMRQRMTQPQFLLYIYNNITSQIDNLKEVSKYLNDYGLHSCMSGPVNSCSWIDHCETRVKKIRQILEERKKSLIAEYLDV
jgi:chromosome segregation ATPase